MAWIRLRVLAVVSTVVFLGGVLLVRTSSSPPDNADHQRRPIESDGPASTFVPVADRRSAGGADSDVDKEGAVAAALDLAAAAQDDPLRQGLELSLRELHRIAEAHGLAEVAPGPGDAFDPERHQAMSMAEDPAVAPGTVSRLFQKGYVLNERLLRPALVVVAAQD